MKKLLLKNSLTGVAQSGINFILLMVAVPVFIKLLGSENYGVFSLVMIVGNLNIFTNLGLSQALLKFLAEQGKGQESDHDIIISVLLLLVILLPLLGGGVYCWQYVLVKLFGLSLTLAMNAKWLLIWALMANFFIMLGQIPKAILDSLQKIYITSWLQALYSFIYWGLIILAVTCKQHLDYVGLAVFAAAFIWFVTIFTYALLEWHLPTCEKLPENIFRVAQKQLSYGGKIYAGGLISFFFEPLTKIVISHLFGIVEVGYFDIVLRIKAQIQSLFQKIFAPLFPLLANWGNTDKTKYLVHDLEKKILLITIPVSCIFFFTISPFLNIWLSFHSSLIDITAKVIIISFFVFSTSALPAYIFFLTCGYPKMTIYLQLINTLINIVILLILHKTAGFFAAPISSATAIFASFVVTVYLQKQIIGESILDEYKYILKIVSSSIVVVFLGYLVSSLTNNDFLSLFIIPFAIFPVVLLQYRALGVISSEDIHYYLGESPLANVISKVLLVK